VRVPIRLACSRCGRGKEACEYCHTLDEIDFQTICDCGLFDFGAHLIDCDDRKDKRWVIAIDYASAEESR